MGVTLDFFFFLNLKPNSVYCFFLISSYSTHYTMMLILCKFRSPSSLAWLPSTALLRVFPSWLQFRRISVCTPIVPSDSFKNQNPTSEFFNDFALSSWGVCFLKWIPKTFVICLLLIYCDSSLDTHPFYTQYTNFTKLGLILWKVYFLNSMLLSLPGIALWELS